MKLVWFQNHWDCLLLEHKAMQGHQAQPIHTKWGDQWPLPLTCLGRAWLSLDSIVIRILRLQLRETMPDQAMAKETTEASHWVWPGWVRILWIAWLPGEP